MTNPKKPSHPPQSPEIHPDTPKHLPPQTPTPITKPAHKVTTPLYGSKPPPIAFHDERAFMQECADRLNSFLHTYPHEAQHVLYTYITYEHELSKHPLLKHSPNKTPGVSVAALFAALLQTHRGTGFVLKPLILPSTTPGSTRLVKFLVVEQTKLDDDNPQG